MGPDYRPGGRIRLRLCFAKRLFHAPGTHLPYSTLRRSGSRTAR
jgi:hypothetical protein